MPIKFELRLAPQLHTLIWPNVPVHKHIQKLGQLAILINAMSPQHVFRYVPRPALRRVETGHPERPAVLAVEQAGDHGIEASVLFVRLGPRAPNTPVIIEHEVYVPVYASDNRR
jgi:hypothetical protein